MLVIISKVAILLGSVGPKNVENIEDTISVCVCVDFRKMSLNMVKTEKQVFCIQSLSKMTQQFVI